MGAACLAAPVLAFAHYPIVTPPAWQATKGEEVVFSYTFGHPFEVELATAARPTRVAVYPPKAETVDVTETLSVRDADAGLYQQSLLAALDQPHAAAAVLVNVGFAHATDPIVIGILDREPVGPDGQGIGRTHRATA